MNKNSQFQSILPKLVIVILILLSILPIGLADLSVIYPMLEALCVFFWSVYRPRLLPYWFAFFIGFCWDALYGWPLGVTALGCVGLRFLVVFYREQMVTHHFAAFWRVAGITISFYAVYKWLALSIMYDEILPKQTALLQWAMTMAFYPIFHGLFNMVCHFLPEQRGDA